MSVDHAAAVKRQQERIELLAETIVPEAVEWVKEIRKYRIYQGKDQEYFKKARIGVGLVSAAIRLSATIENSRTNDLIEARAQLNSGEPAALESGKPQ